MQGGNKMKPRTLIELRVAENMARIAVDAMTATDERRPLALQRLRQAKEDTRVFMYKAKPMLSQNGKLLRP